MVNPIITPPPKGFDGNCSWLSGTLLGNLLGNFIMYLPAIIMILISIFLIRRGRIKKQKGYFILAGFLLIAALGYRVYLSTKGLPLIFYFGGCI